MGEQLCTMYHDSLYFLIQDVNIYVSKYIENFPSNLIYLHELLQQSVDLSVQEYYPT